MPRNKKKQKEIILELLQGGVSVTPMLALNRCGCFRLAAIVHQLGSLVLFTISIWILKSLPLVSK